MNMSMPRAPSRKSQASAMSVAPPYTLPCSTATVTGRQSSSALMTSSKATEREAPMREMS